MTLLTAISRSLKAGADKTDSDKPAQAADYWLQLYATLTLFSYSIRRGRVCLSLFFWANFSRQNEFNEYTIAVCIIGQTAKINVRISSLNFQFSLTYNFHSIIVI